ncbi:MAG: nucleoside phosphorylase [Clostridiales bacterium]|jgi:uridine phosphorylase|nr:nucleoside phosphorylase [Clostridiales bacterium]
MKTLYLQAGEGDISPYVIFSGDPQRVNMIAEFLSDAKKIAFNREFNTVTGFYRGVPVTVSSTGIGAPSAAIALEEMYECGMKVAVRLGTIMGLKDDLLGKLLIPRGAVRGERTGETYAPPSYPAVADYGLLSVFSRVCARFSRGVDNGIIASLDGFYSRMRESRFSKERGTDILSTFADLRRLNVVGVDMESSLILTLGSLMGVKTCVVAMTTVLENLKDFLKGDERARAERDLAEIVLNGVAEYHKEACEDGRGQ